MTPRQRIQKKRRARASAVRRARDGTPFACIYPADGKGTFAEAVAVDASRALRDIAEILADAAHARHVTSRETLLSMLASEPDPSKKVLLAMEYLGREGRSLLPPVPPFSFPLPAALPLEDEIVWRVDRFYYGPR